MKALNKKIGFGIAEMRNWDMKLLERYRPVYHAVNHACSLCALGPCDLRNNRRGACGQDIETFIAREALILAVTGASAHAAHARDVVKCLVREKGRDFPINLGEWAQITMPITQIVAGIRPKKIGDLLPLLGYIDSQIVRLLASTHFGGESSALDLESKTLHAGTMDILSMEIADVAQISGYDFPKGDPDAPLVPIGSMNIPDNKPLILCIGHHSAVGQSIIDVIDDAGLPDEIEVAALCCTAHDMARAGSNKDRVLSIIGNIREQLRFIRTGRPDIVVVDQQCVRLDLLPEIKSIGAFFIATSDMTCAGMPDSTERDPAELAIEMVNGQKSGVFISETGKAAMLSVEIAKQLDNAPSRKKTGKRFGTAGDCTACGLCTKHCPMGLPVSERVYSLKESLPDAGKQEAAHAELSELYAKCIGCAKCDAACPENIQVMSLIETSSGKKPDGWIRMGRGQIDDYEIKNTGPSIVLGDIPGVVAFLTCPDYPDGTDSVSWMAKELAEQGYIVLAAGCAAIDIGIGDDGLYRKFHGRFDIGGIINTGSCVSSAHTIGAVIKVASIFLHRELDGNYAEIADYILNRIGAVGVLWGGITPKSFSASAGANRLGIPVVFGTHGYKFRRMLEGRDEKGNILNARSGKIVTNRLSPLHLAVVVHKKEEALIEIARLCIRPNDTTKGRQTKLRNYIGFSKTFRGKMPEDIIDYLRVVDDMPEEYHEELTVLMNSGNWQPSFIPDPTILESLVRHGNKAD